MQLVFLTAVFAIAGFAQVDAPEEGVRQLWNTQFAAKRPPAKTPAAAPRKPPVYKSVAAAPKPAATAAPKPAANTSISDSLIGLTLWLLRPARPADDPNSRLLILEEDAPAGERDLVPVRMEADTPVKEGDRVRLTVEIPRTGYLYVIDREQYADGTTSAPYLIYPNYKTRPGDNAVAAGRVVEIPDQRDNPNHFRVRKSRPDQTAELLSMLITPEPLPNLQIGRTPLKMPEAEFKDWEQKWGVQAQRFEMEGGAGTAYTAAEKAAGSSPTDLLNQNDPYPQTLYKVSADPAKPLLLNLPVKIGTK